MEIVNNNLLYIFYIDNSANGGQQLFIVVTECQHSGIVTFIWFFSTGLVSSQQNNIFDSVSID